MKENQTAKQKMSLKKKLLIALVALLVVHCIGSVIVVNVIYSTMFHRVDAPDELPGVTYAQVEPDYPRETVTFLSGENTLTGWIYGAANDEALVVLAHGLGSNAERYLAETLRFVDSGYRVLTYDATGTGASGGESTVGMSQSVLDLDAALTFVESRSDLQSLPVLLFGHSWGGYATAEILSYDHDIAASVSVSGYDTPLGLMTETAYGYCGPVVYAGYPFLWLHQTLLFGGAANESAAEAVSASEAPVLIIHGTGDTTISFDGASLISHQAEIQNPNARFLALPDEDHVSVLNDGEGTLNERVMTEVDSFFSAALDAA